MSEAAQHAATVHSMIFVVGFLAIVVAGELLETRTTLHRCATLLGIVLIAAIAMQLATPAEQTGIALGGTQEERAA